MDKRVLSMAYGEEAVALFVELANIMTDRELLAMPPRVIGEHDGRSLIVQSYGHQPAQGGTPVLYALNDRGGVDIWDPEADNNDVGYYDMMNDATRDDGTMDGDALARELFSYDSTTVAPLGSVIRYLRGELE